VTLDPLALDEVRRIMRAAAEPFVRGQEAEMMIAVEVALCQRI
jgi:hypothetical protein